MCTCVEKRNENDISRSSKMEQQRAARNSGIGRVMNDAKQWDRIITSNAKQRHRCILRILTINVIVQCFAVLPRTYAGVET